MANTNLWLSGNSSIYIICDVVQTKTCKSFSIYINNDDCDFCF